MIALFKKLFSKKKEETAKSHGTIMECHMVAGGFDYLLKTRMADMGAYREFAGTVLWQLPGVRETRTYPVMEEVKNTTQLPLLGA